MAVGAWRRCGSPVAGGAGVGGAPGRPDRGVRRRAAVGPLAGRRDRPASPAGLVRAGDLRRPGVAPRHFGVPALRRVEPLRPLRLRALGRELRPARRSRTAPGSPGPPVDVLRPRPHHAGGGLLGVGVARHRGVLRGRRVGLAVRGRRGGRHRCAAALAGGAPLRRRHAHLDHVVPARPVDLDDVGAGAHVRPRRRSAVRRAGAGGSVPCPMGATGRPGVHGRGRAGPDRVARRPGRGATRRAVRRAGRGAPLLGRPRPPQSSERGPRGREPDGRQGLPRAAHPGRRRAPHGAASGRAHRRRAPRWHSRATRTSGWLVPDRRRGVSSIHDPAAPVRGPASP